MMFNLFNASAEVFNLWVRKFVRTVNSVNVAKWPVHDRWQIINELLEKSILVLLPVEELPAEVAELVGKTGGFFLLLPAAEVPGGGSSGEAKVLNGVYVTSVLAAEVPGDQGGQAEVPGSIQQASDPQEPKF